MKITWERRGDEQHGPEDTRPASWRIVIDVDREDDPQGYLWGLISQDGLEGVLRLYGQGQEIHVDGDGDLWGLLVDNGRVTDHLRTRFNGFLWAARDTYGMSWRQLENATDLPQKQLRGIVERTREAYADLGYWRDERGRHFSEDAEVARLRAAARERELAARRTLK